MYLRETLRSLWAIAVGIGFPQTCQHICSCDVAIAVIREVVLDHVLKDSIEQQIQHDATRRLLGHEGAVPTA